MEQPQNSGQPLKKKTGTEIAGPDSFRHRYREKPDIGRKSPVRLERLTRTIVLASVAFGAIMLYLVRDLGLDGGQLLEYVKAAVVFVLTFLGLGIVLGGLIVAIRRFFSRRREVSEVAASTDQDVAEKPGRSPD